MRGSPQHLWKDCCNISCCYGLYVCPTLHISPAFAPSQSSREVACAETGIYSANSKQAHAVPQTETWSIAHDQERDIIVVAVLELAWRGNSTVPWIPLLIANLQLNPDHCERPARSNIRLHSAFRMDLLLIPFPINKCWSTEDDAYLHPNCQHMESVSFPCPSSVVLV